MQASSRGCQMMTKSGASNRDVKKINRIRTMRSIFDCDRISQPELAAKVGNSWPTVLQNVKELMEMGLVQEVGTFESTGGRKAKAFAPVRNARYAVGLEITQNHIGAVFADLSGELVRFERKKRPFERSDTYAAMLAELVQSLLAKEDCPPEKVLGVGISLPGILDRDEQTLVYSHALGLRNVPVEEFSRHIPFPCRFINDANAAGLAEFRGQQSPRSVVYLSLSHSVGGSIFTGGSLYGGEHLRAGEFGHMTLVPDGRPCYCGKRGCLDAYCSAKVLSDRTDGNLALFFDGLRAGNPDLQAAWNEYLSYLAVAVNNLRMIFDCDVIVGGYVGGFLSEFGAPLRELLAQHNTFEPDSGYLKCSRYKLESSALGAALVHIEAFIQSL